MAVLTYKCPSCGGGLKFDAEKQTFLCEFCESTFTKEQVESFDPASQAEIKNDTQESDSANESDTTMLYTCPSCGAEIATDATTAATFCYYCHNPVVLSGRLDKEYLPSKVIPFAFDRDEAVKRFMAWIKKKKFVPKDFFSQSQVEKITGIYFPYWLVDSDIDGAYSAKGIKTRVWCVGDIEYTETSTYDLQRAGSVHLEDITKCALKKLNKQLVESVQPFDGTGMLDFSSAYLLGFQAEKRDIEREALEAEVKTNIKDYTERLFRDTINGYVIRSQQTNASIVKADWEYTLLPVWALTYKKNDKMFYYAMNGQTGKINGELPVDKAKLWRVAGIAAAVLLAVSLLIAYLI